jgi:hypothetical protein
MAYYEVTSVPVMYLGILVCYHGISVPEPYRGILSC